MLQFNKPSAMGGTAGHIDKIGFSRPHGAIPKNSNKCSFKRLTKYLKSNL